MLASTPSGLARGRRREDADGRTSVAFYGIPFAQDPVGPLRFAPPVPAKSWPEQLDATEPSDVGLHVNVFTPDLDARLPVLFWIHGGGFTSGSPLDEQLDGMSLNRAGIVLVSASYRLGFEGFGHVARSTCNRGVLDWMLALEWVQRSISSFGGDPHDVTVGGHSAGGGAALMLLGMPSAQHLFRRMFSLSGVLGEVTPARARERAARLARLAGTDRAGLRSLAPTRLRELLPEAKSGLRGTAATAERLREGLPWGPVVDGKVVEQGVLDALRTGTGSDKPVLLGAADDEFAPRQLARRDELAGITPDALLRDIIPDNAARRTYLTANLDLAEQGNEILLGRLVSDRICRVLVPQIADLRAGAEAQTWTYRFGWSSPVTGSASHTTDLPFWFDGLGKPRALRLLGDDAPQSLADAMHAALVGFIRDGDPGWPSWQPRRSMTQVFGHSVELSTDTYEAVGPLMAQTPSNDIP